MPAILVAEENYQQLLDALYLAIPKSLTIISLLRNVLRGRLEANFYVDQWPDYKAVVCQCIWPRNSDVADIGAYTTSSKALLSVLTEGNLVTWGKRQIFERIESHHADYLLEHLRPPTSVCGLKSHHERVVMVYHENPFGDRKTADCIDVIRELIPDGIVLGSLQPQHAKMISSHWSRLRDWSTEPYFWALIKHCFCPALYSVGDLDSPVSYCVTYPCGKQFAWTDKKYRGKQLSFYLALYSLIIEPAQNILEQEVTQHHKGRIQSELEHGGFPTYNVKDLIIDHVFTSKL